MNVLLVSQCDKRALTETRRILDQFAERRGDRTWQTPITDAGLRTLRQLLRKTARKNTSVACHWIRGHDHSELLWIVGDARRFNGEGAVPTNTTTRNVLRQEDENDWHTAEDIRLFAQMSALLHDLGKASVAFQERLRGQRSERNLIRHEWVSLRLFLAFVGGDDDATWLQRLASEESGDASIWTGPGRYLRDGVDPEIQAHPFRELTDRAPLAAAIGWLVVTHHRLPMIPSQEGDRQAWLGKKAGSFNQAWLEQPLSQVTHAWNEIKQAVAARDFEPYWALAAALPVELPAWQKQAARVAKGLLALHQRRPSKWLDNAYVMHLARLSLMLADHHYSSLGVGDDGRPAEGRKPYLQAGQELFANTWKDRRGRSHGKQSLSEHLLGVAGEAGLIAHALPGFERHLPRLANHRGLRKRSADPRFQWQDKAYDAAAALREVARDHGAFVVNMASTGCGKTLANARILYALADPQRGLRASYALGLRTLTLQTGQSYRRDLHLGEDELAVLVGGAASRALYAYYEQRAEGDGSASVQSLLEEDSHVLYEGNEATHPLLVRALADPSIRRLLSAPMLTCTVDHLVPATESLRGGRQIAPMLRLMSADLVLDELDDYDLKDLPTLARLLHWAGMLGTRVVLSSATLPPALVEGMFRAYQAGRRVFRRNRGTDCAAAGEHIEVPCLWADEFGVQTKRCADVAALSEAHAEFVQRRVDSLGKRPPQRLVKLWPLQIKQGRREQLRAALAAQVREACLHMHTEHAEVEPITGQRVSFGIVRMANIDPIIDVARELYRMGAPEGVHIHLCVYHARFPLAQRSHIEHLLDEVLDRREQGGVWSRSAVRAAIDAAPQCEHLFLVLASPVCEVGRDWDADWAVAEPSSMRSLIQLAGRVKRHRPGVPTTPNVVVFDTNLRALEQRQPAYSRPGYESAERFALRSHRLGVLWPDADGQRLDATPRIWPRPLAERQPANNWIDLEHARLEAAMQPLPEPAAGPLSASAAGERSRPGAVSLLRLERDHCTPSWHFPQAALLGVLPQEQPFREDNRPDSTLVWLPDEDEEDLSLHRIEHALEKAGKSPYVEATESLLSLEQGMGVVPWGAMGRPELLKHLRELAEVEGFGLREAACKFATVDVPTNPNTLAWRWHPWLGYTEQR